MKEFKEAPPIYTVGHSTRSIDDFVGLLRAGLSERGEYLSGLWPPHNPPNRHAEQPSTRRFVMAMVLCDKSKGFSLRNGL